MVSPGDICSYTRFEVRVESVTDNRASIAYAVFDLNGEKLFDSDNLKEVPLNRLKVVYRPTSSTADTTPISPTFSDRQEKCRLSQVEVVDIGDDSQEKKPIGRINSSVEKSKKKQSKRQHVPMDSPVPNSDETSSSRSGSSSGYSGSSSSSDDSSYSTQEVNVRTRRNSSRRSEIPKIRRVRKIQRNPTIIGEVTVPIVSDDCFDNSGSDMMTSDEESCATSVASDFSQERNDMQRMAEEYEQRAKRDKSTRSLQRTLSAHREGVEKPARISVASSRLSQFIISDTPLDLVEERTGFTEILQGILDQGEEAPLMGLLERVWALADACIEIHDYLEIGRILRKFFNSKLTIPNIEFEVRAMYMNRASFRSHTGWFVGMVTALVFSFAVRKKDLFDRLAENYAKKIPSHKADIKILFPIARLVAGDAPDSACAERLMEYGRVGKESQELIEQLVRGMLDWSEESTETSIPAQLNSGMSNFLSHFCPAPAEVTPTLTARLESDPLLDRVVLFLARGFNINCIRFGGFSPDASLGSRRVHFGKHKGRLFSEVVADAGYCRWCETEFKDPYNAEMAHWLDYMFCYRQFCVLGPTSIRAGVELARLGKENLPNPEWWLLSRGATARKCLLFFSSLPNQTAQVRDFFAYAQCACILFDAIRVQLRGGSTSHLLRHASAPPRAEIINEVFRPLLRFGDIFPRFREIIAEAVVVARAACLAVPMDQARRDLRTQHQLAV